MRFFEPILAGVVENHYNFGKCSEGSLLHSNTPKELREGDSKQKVVIDKNDKTEKLDLFP